MYRHPSKSLWTGVAGVLAICVVFAALRWVKLNSLVWGDPPMWMLQVSRAASGELPYRDFTWNYPPFTLWFFDVWLGLFGATFASVQAAIDLVSLAITLLGYWILRRFLPGLLHLPVILLLVAIGATAQTKFTLFSLLTYSPSLHFATLGLLMMIAGVLSGLEAARAAAMLLIVSGAFIAETSKPESLLAALVLLTIYMLVSASSWSWRILLIAACTLPAIAGYAWESSHVGWDNFKTGLTGYGLATLACPWWPTGLGVYGAVAALAEAWLIAAIASMPSFRRRPRWLIAGAVPCGLFYLSYYWYLNRDVLESAQSWKSKLLQVAPLLLWTSPVLLPVMWAGILYCCYLLYRMARRRIEPAETALLFLLVVPVAMSSRSLFGTTLFPITEVSAVCYGFFILLGPILLWRYVKTAWVVAALVLFYSALRIAGGYSGLLSGAQYTWLETQAGRVQLLNDEHDGSADLYRYAAAHTGPTDALLDLPYGGGINFALRRREPTFSTMWLQLRPPLKYQALDVTRMRERHPALILANDAPMYRTEYGYPAKMSCPCPRLVWQPDQLSGDPAYVFPLVRYIEDNYRVDRKIGMKLILVPK